MKREIFAALLFGMLSLTAHSQSAIQWQNTIGGNRADQFTAMGLTKDGGYILGGYSASEQSGDKSETHFGTVEWNDYWVVKIDKDGNVEWDNTIGANGQEILGAVEQTVDGGYILGGYTTSGMSGDKSEDSLGGAADIWIVKLDTAGVIQWENTIGGSGDDYLEEIHQTADNGYIIGGYSNSGISGDKSEPGKGLQDYWVIKLDSLGSIVWQKTIGGSSQDIISSISQAADGGYILGGYSISNTSGDKTEDRIGLNDFWIVKLDVSGVIQWDNTIGGTEDEREVYVRPTNDGGYILGGASFSTISGDKTENNYGEEDYWIIKLDAFGNIQWQNTIGGNDQDVLAAIHQTTDEGYILAGSSQSDVSGDKTENGLGDWDYWVIKLNTSGNIAWQNTIGGLGADRCAAISEDVDKGFIIGGTSISNSSGDKTENNLGVDDYWVLKLRPATNLIEGHVFIDDNVNCVPDLSEVPLNRMLLKISPWNIYTTTDDLGYYSFNVDTGSYTVQLVTKHPYLRTDCPAPGTYLVNLSSVGDTSSNNNFGMEVTFPCPLLEVDISTPFLKRCLNSTYTVHYCNRGTTPASNVFVEVISEPFITVNGSSIPWRLPQTGETYVFDVGNLDIGDCGSFTIDITVDCDSTVLGQTHCVKAHIFPDTLCSPVSTLWDSSSVKVEGECINEDTIQFRITNTGPGNMGDSLPAIIVEDIVMLRSLKFKLNSGLTMLLNEPANGSTFRLEAQQSFGHPGKSMPSVSLEGCGSNNSGSFSLGYVTVFQEDDANTFISIDCQENIGAYDPNDKIGYPKGVGMQKIIHSEYELEYKIRFQNTGTDTAIRVVIRDTLSEFLDITSVVPGASSHAYQFRIYGPRVLEWTFDNILLPDSNTNEPESHGFVKFRVAQVDSNMNGTLIENSADIYFDYNAPVKTNTEFHTVGEVYDIILSVSETFDRDNAISIYPNPFRQQLNIELGTDPLGSLSFEICDLQGRIIRRYKFFNTNHFTINNLNLQAGIYFYRITTDEQVIGKGKMIGY